ncbi:MAG: ABC transporter permease [Bacteroidota bacterium]
MQQEQNQYPPRLATQLLVWFLKSELAEEVLGDLEENYLAQIEKNSLRKAKINYWYQVLNYLRPFAIRNNLISDLNPFFMFGNHFKIAWRQLLKQKRYSFINITGMTLGMTCFILIALYIQYELSFDLQHEHTDRIYRIVQRQPGNEFKGSDAYAIAPMTIGPEMEKQFPEVEATTTLTRMQFQFAHEDQVFSEIGLMSDAFLLDVFSYPVVEGDAKAALKNKEAIILTQSLAEKYFGKQSPLGKEMQVSEGRKFIVEAVLEDIPENQHFHFDFILSLENYGEYREDRERWRWSSNNYCAYALLQEGANPQHLEEKLKIFDPEIKKSYADVPFHAVFFLQPLKDIHLQSHLNFEMETNSDIRYLYLSASIALIILLLALINYMNLATAGFGQRSKEVGVRKVIGARKRQLVQQFMAESILITLLSFSLAVGLAQCLLPSFQSLLGLEVPFDLFGNRFILLTFSLVALVLGSLSGLYPAILSTAVTTASALNGTWFKGHKGNSLFRNTLVIGQFTAAVILAVCSVVIFQQLQYIQHKKLGFNREQIVYVPYRNQHIFEKNQLIRSELIKHPQIEQVAFTTALPLDNQSQTIVDEWEGNSQQDEVFIYRIRTDYDFIDLFEINLIEGRNFSPDHPSDSSKTYILNQAALKALGWQSAAGKSFRDGKVIGVVEDFHFQRFDYAIEPTFITFHNKVISYYAGHIAIKINGASSQETIAHIQKTLKTTMPQMPFKIRYMDESFKRLYKKEHNLSQVFILFTIMALLIACMGLFGLVTQLVLLRSKEIGIRKVLGASASHVVQLISKDFLKLVLLATFIAIPISWWSMRQWLQDFAYRIELEAWVFLAIGGLALFIAFATISLQSFKVALSNPVEAIKTE